MTPIVITSKLDLSILQWLILLSMIRKSRANGFAKKFLNLLVGVDLEYIYTYLVFKMTSRTIVVHMNSP